jgi:hypothetical protein
MEYFVLQSIIKLVKDQKPYGIQGLRDIYNNVQETLAPTEASIKSGLLEWLIPNNQFNQAWISQHYSHFKILQAGKENKFIMEGMPVALDKSQEGEKTPVVVPSESEADMRLRIEAEMREKLEAEYLEKTSKDTLTGDQTSGDAVKHVPLDVDSEVFKALEKVEQIKLLKADKIAELKSLGINAPTNSKLETLDKKLEEARKGNTED